MEPTTRYRMAVWAILILVILNLGILGTFWYDRLRKPPRSEERPSPEQFLIRELKLDSAQADSVRHLRRDHFAQTDSIKAEMVRLNMRMMDELFSSTPDTPLVRNLSDQIGRHQAEFDRQVYRHFADVKAVLRPDQYELLHRLVSDALKKRMPSAESDSGRSGMETPAQEGNRDRRPPPAEGGRNPKPQDDRRPPPPRERADPAGH